METQVLQQQAQLEQWERRWRARDEEEAKRGAVVPASPAAGSYNYAEFSPARDGDGAGAAAPPPPLLLHDAPQTEVDEERTRRLIAAEGALAGERQQRSLVESQL